LKLAPLLASYLFTHKRLELPGLGTFLLDPLSPGDTENKTGKPVNMDGVSFENKPAIREAPELVQYISTQTGKIRALAAADLESHLGLAQQFLNIGKPFLFEGIGSLVKTRSGEFAFESGGGNTGTYTTREINSTSSTEESFTDYNNVFNPRKTTYTMRRPIVFFLVLLGVGLAIWGGYTVYKKNASRNRIANATDAKNPTEPAKNQSLTVAVAKENNKDSVVINKPVASTGELKFVLETANAKRAIPRYNQLKSFQWRLQMETKDSVNYKLYLMLPVAAADTSNILDSLTRLYGKRPYIEKSVGQ